MNKLIAALAVAAVALPFTSQPSSATGFGQGGKQATLESAPTAKGERTFFKTVELECAGSSCVGTFKGKAGRVTTIGEMQCGAGSDGQIQAGQVAIEAVLVEILPIASRSTNGTDEIAVIKTPTNFVLDGAQQVAVNLFFFGTANFASCIAKSSSTPS